MPTLAFRGFTAAASLKPEIRDAAEKYYAHAFRGFTAAASLKLELVPRMGWDVSDAFRGFTAAASLKHDVVVPPASRLPGFPRFHRRGLIEASTNLFASASSFQAFRGFTAAASLKPRGPCEPSTDLVALSAVSPPRPH